MRVLLVSYQHPEVSPGGSQQLAYEMLQSARARGHDAYLVCALEPHRAEGVAAADEPLAPAPGEDRQYFYVPSHYDGEQLSAGDWRSLSAFCDLVASLQPDAIHFHHYHFFGAEAIRAARLAAPGARIWVTFHEMLAICMADGVMVRRGSGELCHAATPINCHGCFPHRRPEFFLLRATRLRALLGLCDGYVFPSRFLAERYVAWGLNPGKCRIVPNGLAHPAPNVAMPGPSRELNRFAFFGQDLDHKGLDVALEAMLRLARSHRLPDAGLDLFVNGGNREFATRAYRERMDCLLREIAEIADGRIRVRELGGYNRAELAERMRMTDWVLVPSTCWESFGLVVSEAWMFGRPVIVSDIGGLGERVSHDVNGLKFPPGDSAALAELIAGAAGDKALWRRLHEAARPEASALDMLDAYASLWGAR